MYTNDKELIVFLSILLYFSYNSPKDNKDALKKSGICHNEFINSKMTHKRFSFLYAKFNMFSKNDKKDV